MKSKTCLNFTQLSPINFVTSLSAWTVYSGSVSSDAMIAAVNVFPVPGLSYRSIFLLFESLYEASLFTFRYSTRILSIRFITSSETISSVSECLATETDIIGFVDTTAVKITRNGVLRPYHVLVSQD